MDTLGPELAGMDWFCVVSDPTASRVARRHVAAWLQHRAAQPHTIADLSLAASELAANVVQHGDVADMLVGLDDRDPEWWTMTVVGGVHTLPLHLHDPAAWTVSGPNSVDGRGLGIVRQLVDHVEVDVTHDGLRICCRRAR